jgi:NADH dehydrogenase FAD-containing subunit
MDQLSGSAAAGNRQQGVNAVVAGGGDLGTELMGIIASMAEIWRSGKGPPPGSVWATVLPLWRPWRGLIEMRRG